jgi:hypothetical protein
MPTYGAPTPAYVASTISTHAYTHTEILFLGGCLTYFTQPARISS